HNKSAGEDRKITSVALPAMGAGCGQVPPDSVARQIVLI
ncbi:phage tail protein, partial [Salmonella enterica subsp. enterica serovar Virchow]|nr:phage tail protein [Salmonella enterica subsp. enterica serovar Virchow]